MSTDTTWQPLWDQLFSEREWGRYPPEELIRFVARNYYRSPNRARIKILEVGCGPGANIWYLAREGFAATGVDGSAVAIERARTRLTAETLTADLRVGDINHLTTMFGNETFDAVIDVGCLVCLTAAGQAAVVGQIHKILKPGGRMFSRLFGRGSWGEGEGREIEPNTFDDIPQGPLAGVGRIRFSSVADAQTLLAAFGHVVIETSRQSYENMTREVVHLIITATKA